MLERIYMDHNATTPLDPEVLEAMMPYLTERFGNPSSTTHAYGKVAAEAVEAAREEVAALIGARPREIVFTSGATESDNLAIRGVAESLSGKGNHLVTGAIEHKAVLDTCKHLQKKGWDLTVLPVDRHGLVDPNDVRSALTDRTILVSIQHANSEVGTIQPVEEIGRITRERGVIFHVDAAQTLGKVEVDVALIGCDLLAMSGHKIYGPKGVGALYIRRGVRVVPLLTGGGQERNLRPGTLNVAGIVGLGRACAIARSDVAREGARLRGLRDHLVRLVLERIDEVELNGHPVRRLPNNANFTFRYVEGEGLIMSLRDVAVSSGSACASGALEGSYVIHALGADDDRAHSSVRFGLGKSNTLEQVEHVVGLLEENVRRLREMSPVWGMVKAGIDLKSVKWTE